MFLDCPAYLDQEGAVRCGLPAEVRCRFIMCSSDGPLESAMIRCPAGHGFNGPIESLTWESKAKHDPGTAGAAPAAAPDRLPGGHNGRAGTAGSVIHGPGEPGQTTRSHAQFAGWTLDLSSRELMSPAGEEVRLTTGEFDLLAAFVNNPNQVLSRDRLLDLARNREAGPFDRTIDVQVGRLRRKLEDDSQNPTLIKTVRGSGYIFTPAVELS